MSDTERPEFFQHCDKIKEHYDNLKKELHDSQLQLVTARKSLEDAKNQTKFNYEIAANLNSELHRYTDALRKIQIGLNNISQKAPTELKSEVNRLNDFLNGYIQPERNGYTNGTSNGKNSEYESRRKISGRLLRRSSHVIDVDSPLDDANLPTQSPGNSSINVEQGSEGHSANGGGTKIKDELMERSNKERSSQLNVRTGHNTACRSRNETSENGHEGAHNSRSRNSTAEINSEDRVEPVYHRRSQRRHRLQNMRERDGDSGAITAPRSTVRAPYYDIPRMNNVYYGVPEYGPSMYNQMNNSYYDVYNSGIAPCYPMQYMPQNRPPFNGEATMYNGNGALNGLTYQAQEPYLDFMNNTTEMRTSQSLAESSEDIRRSTIGPNALKVKTTYMHDDVVSSVALGADHLAATAGKGLIKLWDTRRLQADVSILNIDTQNTKYIRSCKITKDGRNLIVAGECDYIGLWDLESYNSGALIKAPTRRIDVGNSTDACYSLIVTNNGRVCYGGCSNGAIIVWDLISNKIVNTIKGHSDVVTCMDMPMDSNVLYSGSLDCSVIKWDIREYKVDETIKNRSQVFSIAASTNCRWVTVGLENSIVNIFSNEEKKIELKVHTNSVLGMKMAPNNDWLLSVGKDGWVNAIKMPHGPPVHRTCEEGKILSCDMSTDVRHVLTGSSGRKSTLYEVLL